MRRTFIHWWRERERERERGEREIERERERKIFDQKIDQTSIKICLKKSIKNRSKINQKCSKNPSWRGPGGLLGALGGHYRKKRAGPCFFGPSWGRLGRLLARLGGLLGPSWPSWRPLRPVLGPSWRPKSDPDSTQPRCKDRSFF